MRDGRNQETGERGEREACCVREGEEEEEKRKGECDEEEKERERKREDGRGDAIPKAALESAI